MISSGKALLKAFREPASRDSFCFVFLMLGALFKFCLIAKSDIGDALDDPYEYVAQVIHPMAGGVAYGPGTGLFGRFFYEFGIPFRLGIEAAFMLALAWVLSALIESPRKSYLSCGVFLFAIFNPTPTELFSHFLSDQIWMVETMLGVAYMVFALRDPLQPKWLLLACSALLLGFSTITRSCYALLAACLLFFTLIGSILIVVRGGWARGRTYLFTFVISMGTVVLGISTFYFSTCAYNLRHLHYFGISAVDCDQYKDFYLCLQSVGDPTGVNYFPVDEDRRKLIATAGPQSKALMEQIDGITLFKEIGFKTYGKYDVALGWFQFAIFAANDSDVDRAYARFKEVEREIHDAAQRGQLKVRPILPLPDCRLSLVLPVFPEALRSTIRKVLYEPAPYPSGWSPQKLHYDDVNFSRALTRRSVSDSPLRYLTWRILHAIYAQLYTPAMVIILLALIVSFWAFLAFAWRPAMEDSLSLLGQQFFALLFIALIFWYALFDASGTPVVSRYMIFHNVMLPILIVYYVRAFVGFYRRPRPSRRLCSTVAGG